MSTASLAMYDLPELRPATDALWFGLAQWWRRCGLQDVPDSLTRPAARYEHWLQNDLFFSQTCGYPLTHLLRDRVTLVATPRYAAAGCEDHSYRSLVVVRSDNSARELKDLRGLRLAVNDLDSHSGWNALRYVLRELGAIETFFRSISMTGAHRSSVAAVRSGAADVAAVDCVTFALLAEAAPEEVKGIKVLTETPSAPSLPFITSRTMPLDSVKRLREGLVEAMHDPSLAMVRSDLLLSGVTIIDLSAYDEIIRMEEAAAVTVTEGSK